MIPKRFAGSVALFALIGPSSGVEDIFGFRKEFYTTRCAHACRTAIQESPLECSSKGTTTAKCFASDEPFLETLAFCISSHCSNVSNATIDTFWRKYVAGWDLATPRPTYAYETALRNAGQPTSILPYGKTIDKVYQVAEKDYLIAYTSLADWNESEGYHTKFA